MSDQQIESEIQAKGLAAPRVTPADIEAAIATEHYINLGDAVVAVGWTPGNPKIIRASDGEHLTTVCVLVLHNGFTVVGKSACASPENFNVELGRKIARADAVNQLWPLLGYELKTQLAAAQRV